MSRIEDVNNMKPSKLRHELKIRGFDALDVLRDKLKDILEKEKGVKNVEIYGSIFKYSKNEIFALESREQGEATCSEIKEHLGKVLTQVEGSSSRKVADTSQREKNIQETAKILMKVKKSMENMENTKYETSEAQSYEVEMVLDMRFEINKEKEKRREFLVRWQGFGPDKDSWVKETDMDLPIQKYNLSEKLKEKLGFEMS
eukprot:g6842.t1